MAAFLMLPQDKRNESIDTIFKILIHVSTADVGGKKYTIWDFALKHVNISPLGLL